MQEPTPIMYRLPKMHNFAARCPNGHRPAQSRTLEELRDPEVRFYCRICEHSWQPRHEERARAMDFALASEDRWVTTPPTAA